MEDNELGKYRCIDCWKLTDRLIFGFCLGCYSRINKFEPESFSVYDEEASSKKSDNSSQAKEG